MNWDVLDKCVVVGSFPKHLDNGLSCIGPIFERNA